MSGTLMPPRPAWHGLPAPRRIAVFRALQLGDMLCTVPALRALRAAAPHSHITLIGMPWAASFVERYRQYLDELLPFPGFPGFPERAPDVEAFPRFLEQAQARRFDLVIQMHGSGGLSNPITALLGAKRCAGFHTAEAYRPEAELFMHWDEGEHEVLRFVRLMEFLGVPARGMELEFPLSEHDHAELERACPALPSPGHFVCVHPGARLPSRRWLPQRFAEVADRLAADGLQVVLTGSADEREVVDAVKKTMRAPVIDLCGKTSLGALAALLARARLVVCNDTGISHMAAALATPSVIICCGSDPRRWAPLDHARHRVIGASVDCRPCMNAICPTGHECAQQVTAAQVAVMARHVMMDNPGGRP